MNTHVVNRPELASNEKSPKVFFRVPESVDKSVSLKVNLTPRARDVIDGIRDDTGVPNTEAMARLLEWFAGLDRKLRLAVLTRDIETQRELTALVLKDMAGDAASTHEHGPLAELSIEQLAALQEQVAGRIAKLATEDRRAAQPKAKKP